MTAYYNEFDRHAAAALWQLIADGLIAPGDVDERSIKDVQADDIKGYDQVHLFAGGGGWSVALRLAGWPDDAPVWTGSCPCQPFSTAGKRTGTADERHLWPEMFRLVAECKPAIVFGEQVESAVRHGWLDGVFSDLESEGYACGAHVLGAHSVGAPHIRQRLYWVADAENYDARTGLHASEQERNGRPVVRRCRAICRMDDAVQIGWRTRTSEIQAGRNAVSWTGRSCGTVECGDARTRRIEPGLVPLVDGLPGRVAALRIIGNSIVPQVAAEFITAYIEAKEELKTQEAAQ